MARPKLPHVPLWSGAAYRLVDLKGDTEIPMRLIRTSSMAYPRIHIFEHLDIAFPIKELEVVEVEPGSYQYMNTEMQLELA